MRGDMTIAQWIQDRLLFAVIGELSEFDDRITRMEKHMASASEKLAQIDEASTRQAEGLLRVSEVLASVRDQVANMDTNLAEKLTPVVDTLNAHADRLFELASDPQNPVPNPEPVPDPGTEVPVS